MDLDAFLCLNRLMQTFGPTTTRHQTSSEFINDDDLAILNHVLLIAVKQRMRSERGIEVMHQNDVLRRIQTRAVLDQAAVDENLFEMLVPLFGDVDLVGLFIHPVIAVAFFVSLTLQQRRNLVDALI